METRAQYHANGGPPPTSEPATGAIHVTPRQREILCLVAHGWQAPEIARYLCLSRSTVNDHLGFAYHRIGAVNAAHAVAILLSAGIITYRPELAAQRGEVTP
jgi:DNA-binding CsgD family transcriptional regulator